MIQLPRNLESYIDALYRKAHRETDLLDVQIEIAQAQLEAFKQQQARQAVLSEALTTLFGDDEDEVEEDGEPEDEGDGFTNIINED